MKAKTVELRTGDLVDMAVAPGLSRALMTQMSSSVSANSMTFSTIEVSLSGNPLHAGGAQPAR